MADQRRPEAQRLFELYERTEQDLADTLKTLERQPDPAAVARAVVEAERRRGHAIQTVAEKLGPKYGDPLGTLRDKLLERRDAASRKKREQASRAMQGKAAVKKELEGVGVEKKGAVLDQKVWMERGKGLPRDGALLPAPPPASGRREVPAGVGGTMRPAPGSSPRPGAAAVPENYKVAGVLDAGGLRRRGYSEENIRDLERGIHEASDGIKKLHTTYPSATADAYHNGTLTNIEDSFKWSFSGGKYGLNRGCRSHQDAVLTAAPKDSSIAYEPIMYGKGLEHHAVVAFPKPPDEVRNDPARYEQWWKSRGVVIDGWRRQTSDASKILYKSVGTWSPAILAPRLEDQGS